MANKHMSPWLVLAFIGFYFFALLFISWITTRNSNQDSYFLGNHQSPWYAVAFGMIGDSLSGVTFISVPGQVGTAHFSYMQIVLGYVIGYWIIASVLLPLYYRLQLTSIYSYLLERFGPHSQKTGSFFFLISRLLGAAGRLYLAIMVLQIFVFEAFEIPFAISVAVIILLMLFYTLKGGIKTLVWTDTFQSAFLLAGVVFSIVFICQELGFSFSTLLSEITSSPYSKILHWDVNPGSFFGKQFLAGIFICIAMTGLDQNMMQKNLSCRSLADAQKNMYWFSLVVLIVNLLFVSLGALLYIYATAKGISIPEQTDKLFPTLALNHLGTAAGLVFIIGLTAATFNSADSVLTTLTTSFYIDFLKQENRTERNRYIIHIVFGVLLLLVILAFKALNQDAIISTILKLAGYTYGPLLGLFILGILTKRRLNDSLVPFICILAPVLTYILEMQSKKYFTDYKIGPEILIFNAALTVFGLLLISKQEKTK